MIKYLAALFLISAPLQAQDEQRPFQYNKEEGVCKNRQGKEGFNKADPKQLFRNYNKEQNAYPDVDAECVDFRNFDFNFHIGFGYPRLTNWNLSGANLEGAKFHFADMLQTNFKGANLKMSWGYTTLTGEVDKHTTPPDNCVPEKNKINCRQ